MFEFVLTYIAYLWHFFGYTLNINNNYLFLACNLKFNFRFNKNIILQPKHGIVRIFNFIYKGLLSTVDPTTTVMVGNNVEATRKHPCLFRELDEASSASSNNRSTVQCSIQSLTLFTAQLIKQWGLEQLRVTNVWNWNTKLNWAVNISELWVWVGTLGPIKDPPRQKKLTNVLQEAITAACCSVYEKC